MSRNTAVAKLPLVVVGGPGYAISALSQLSMPDTSTRAAILNNSHAHGWVPTKPTSLLQLPVLRAQLKMIAVQCFTTGLRLKLFSML